MGKNSYIGGSTVWNGKQSAPTQYAAPKYQSLVSARLLGSNDTELVAFGKALMHLERSISIQIESIKNNLDPDYVQKVYAGYSSSLRSWGAGRPAAFGDFKSDREKDASRGQTELAELNAELHSALTWAERPTEYVREIRAFVKKQNRG